jgi:copper homeostasis protein
MSKGNFVIEIATTDFESTRAAVAGGADRIELCTALSEGGLTPSLGLIRQCRSLFESALFPIIRPRSGDFLYTNEEFEIIKQDALFCKEMGCDGVVIGFLNPDGTVNTDRTASIVDLVYPLEVTFHRAFDRCRDPFEGLEAVIKAGCQRVLSSGQQPTAPEGIDLLQQLVSKAEDRIVIMPGSGVRAENIKNLAEKTGAVEFHSSLKGKTASQMEYLHPAFAQSAESYSHPAILPEAVRQLRRALLS